MIPFYNQYTAQSKACAGDMPFSTVSNFPVCQHFPFNTNSVMGWLYLDIAKFPCPDLNDVTMCVGFDSCGTETLGVSGGMINCLSDVTGPGKIIGLLAKFADSISVGISTNRKYEKQTDIFYPTANNNMAVDSFLIRGHLFLDIELTLPEDFLGNFAPFVSDFVNISGSLGILLVDYNNVDIQPVLNDIYGLTKGDIAGFFNLVSQFGEIYFEANASLNLNFSDVTDGALPDLSFNAFTGNVLIVNKGGNSGLPSGIYIRTEVNFTPDVTPVINKALSHLSSVFKGVNIQLPAPASTDNSKFGVFVTASAIGFSATWGTSNLSCFYNLNDKKMACQVNSDFITFVSQAGQWLVSKSVYLFDEAETVVMKLGADITNFEIDATNQINSAVQIVNQEANNILNTAQNYVNGVFSNVASTVTNGINQGVQDGVDWLKKLCFWC
jgi:hypothetical protein